MGALTIKKIEIMSKLVKKSIELNTSLIAFSVVTLVSILVAIFTEGR